MTDENNNNNNLTKKVSLCRNAKKHDGLSEVMQRADDFVYFVLKNKQICRKQFMKIVPIEFNEAVFDLVLVLYKALMSDYKYESYRLFIGGGGRTYQIRKFFPNESSLEETVWKCAKLIENALHELNIISFNHFYSRREVKEDEG